jgi:hypothetical protein
MVESNSTSTTSFFSFPNITHLLLVKLDGNNYLMWLSQFLPVLRRNKLLGIVDGSLWCPPKFPLDFQVMDSSTINLEYVLWIKKDQYLLSWINATLIEKVLATVYGLNTSKQN